MRKLLFAALLLLVLFAVLPASARTFTFDDVYLSLEVPDSYIIITPDNAQEHAQLLLAKGYNAAEVPDIFAAEGILLQAWNTASDMCFEVTAVRDADAEAYFDLDQQSAARRAEYRKDHRTGEAYKLAGYKYASAEWA